MYTWLSEEELQSFSKVKDDEINEALQEVRGVMPQWFISEIKRTYRKKWYKKETISIYYTVYKRINDSSEVRYQSSAFDKPTILNLLYGLYMGYYAVKVCV